MNWFRFGRRRPAPARWSNFDFTLFPFTAVAFAYQLCPVEQAVRSSELFANQFPKPSCATTDTSKNSKVCLLRNYNLINGTTLKHFSHAIHAQAYLQMGIVEPSNDPDASRFAVFYKIGSDQATRTPFIHFDSNENFQFWFVFLFPMEGCDGLSCVLIWCKTCFLFAATAHLAINL